MFSLVEGKGHRSNFQCEYLPHTRGERQIGECPSRDTLFPIQNRRLVRLGPSALVKFRMTQGKKKVSPGSRLAWQPRKLRLNCLRPRSLARGRNPFLVPRDCILDCPVSDDWRPISRCDAVRPRMAIPYLGCREPRLPATGNFNVAANRDRRAQLVSQLVRKSPVKPLYLVLCFYLVAKYGRASLELCAELS